MSFIPYFAPFCGTDTSYYTNHYHSLRRQGHSHESASQQHAVFLKSMTWPNKSTIKVSFVDDNADEWKKAWVEKCIKERLEPHVNLKFKFLNTQSSGGNDSGDIRVTFNTNGSFTQIGIGNNPQFPEPPSDRDASCHLGWVDPPNGRSFNWNGRNYDVPENAKTNGNDDGATVVHEFGHALGMLHEHQSPDIDFGWYCDKVLDYYGSSQGWSNQQVCDNILNQVGRKPECSECNSFTSQRDTDVAYSKYDPDSIMAYPIEAGMCKAFPNGMKTNNILSKKDVEWLSKFYPGKEGSQTWTDTGNFSPKKFFSNHLTIIIIFIVLVLFLILLL